MVVPGDVGYQDATMILPLISLLLMGPSSLVAPAHIAGKITLSSGKPAKWAVIWLEGREHSKPLKNSMIDQRDRTFIPHVSVVTVGTKVLFPNNDTIYHNVFADYDAKKFDLSYYKRGDTKSLVFDKTGLVYLLCQIHEEMSAFILVVDTPYYAKADEKGDFSITGVPSGTYKLSVWHENRETERRQLVVSGDQTGLNIQLHLQ
ncbi:hypothetical protein BH11ARM1_BH11ARM1_07350 [soil metagenome]